MISWYYIAALSVLFLLFLLYQEWKRKNKARLAFRLLASAGAVSSLLLMTYPYASAPGGAVNSVIVLTDGFNNDSLQRFLMQNKNQRAQLFSGDRLLIDAYPDLKISFVPDPSSFFVKHDNDTLHVFGNGFNKKELSALHNHPMVFHAPPIFAAIQSVSWTKKLKPGQLFTVQGKFENPTPDPVKIRLRVFNEIQDSAFVAAHSTVDFALHTFPKHAGKAVYTLMVTSGNNILEDEPIPVETEPAANLKILMLSSAPDFENTFLKNRLAQNGYSISTKTIIGRDKTDRQAFNMEAIKTDKLTPAYLEQFDLLITDENVLKSISGTEISAIRSGMADKGMGLMIRLTGENAQSVFSASYFPVKKSDSTKKGIFAIFSPGSDSLQYTLQLNEPVFIHYQPGTQILLEDREANIFAAALLFGEGKIVVTTLDNTYSLALAGNSRAYFSLWSLLLQKAAKKALRTSAWETDAQFSFVNEPGGLTMNADTNSPALPIIGNSRLYLRHNKLLPYQWQGIYWPVSAGWQTLKQQDQKQLDWYVYNTGNWKKLRALENWKTTKKYASQYAVSFRPAGIIHSWLPWMPAYLLLLFLVCCGFLWVEQKKV